MKLLIHDLNEEEWSRISEEYKDWEVISDDGTIKPCAGCFGCWTKTPGQCVIKDGYDKTAAKLHKADEVVVMSRCTYGGFSSFIKNVFDRSIGWVLPFFELNHGEMHHKKRYPEDKPFKVIFRGAGISEKEKKAAKRYVNAVCRNFHAKLIDVVFEDEEADGAQKPAVSKEKANAKVIFLNCSMRGDKANSRSFLEKLSEKVQGRTEILNLAPYIKKPEELASILDEADRVVFGMPLYVDGVPSSPLRIMERLEKNPGKKKRIYVVSNMGFYESAQIRNLLTTFKIWCRKCGYTYGGGIAIGAGEMLGGMMKSKDISKGPTMNVADGFNKLSGAINKYETVEDIYVEPKKFPRAAYRLIANASWPLDAKRNGLKKKDLYKQIED